MAVNVLYDTVNDLACLFCSTSDWAFGPVLYGPDADEKALAFRGWFDTGAALERAHEIGVKTYLGAVGTDPRHYSEHDLELLYSEWRDRFTDAANNLIATAEVA